MKLTQINNNGSTMVCIPKAVLESMSWKVGDEIDIKFDASEGIEKLVLTKKEK